MNRGGGYSVGGPMRGHNGAFGGQGGYSVGGPMRGHNGAFGGGGYDQGAGGYGQQGFAGKRHLNQTGLWPW